jgi:hypothetical protein
MAAMSPAGEAPTTRTSHFIVLENKATGEINLSRDLWGVQDPGARMAVKIVTNGNQFHPKK